MFIKEVTTIDEKRQTDTLSMGRGGRYGGREGGMKVVAPK